MLNYSLLEDEVLVSLCKNNDSKAFAVLTERYISVARLHASRFQGPYAESEDLSQEGMLGFIAAVFAYRQEGGASFSTFANHCIKNRIISAVRSTSSKKHIPSELIVPLEGQQDSLSDEKTPEESLISNSEAERIEVLINNELTEREREVFLRFLAGMSYESIATECGCTVKSVDGTLQRVRKKLRERLN